MTNDHERHALSLSLARLPSADPRPERDARIRSRCHAVLASRSTVIPNLGSVALGAVLCAYAAVALFEVVSLSVNLP